MSSDLITQAQAAALRSVSRAAIADLVKRGKLKKIVVGGVPFVSRRAVLAYKPEAGGRPSKKKKAKV